MDEFHIYDIMKRIGEAYSRYFAKSEAFAKGHFCEAYSRYKAQT